MCMCLFQWQVCDGSCEDIGWSRVSWAMCHITETRPLSSGHLRGQEGDRRLKANISCSSTPQRGETLKLASCYFTVSFALHRTWVWFLLYVFLSYTAYQSRESRGLCKILRLLVVLLVCYLVCHAHTIIMSACFHCRNQDQNKVWWFCILGSLEL